MLLNDTNFSLKFGRNNCKSYFFIIKSCHISK